MMAIVSITIIIIIPFFFFFFKSFVPAFFSYWIWIYVLLCNRNLLYKDLYKQGRCCRSPQDMIHG